MSERRVGRTINKLSAVAVNRAGRPGLYGDGAGLWLQVGPTGGKSWLFRFMLRGRAREMGLGPLHTVSLAQARERARNARALLLDGTDPIEARKQSKAQVRLEEARRISFQDAATEYLKAHRTGWKNAKHAEQWENSLQAYAFPVFGSFSVAAIDTTLVLKCLEPIWRDRTETASRVRGRIESVLDWSAVRGYRHGENPARWRGHLDKLLPARAKVQKVEHHAALPYRDLPAFMAELRSQVGTSARALEFTILTGCRTGEVLNAQWREFDMDRGLWTIPADRMKAGREHRVPLSARAVEILREVEGRDSTYVFESARQDKPLSGMAMLMVLRRMDRADLTVHGFRSTLRDWAAEATSYPNEVAEMALAHTISNKVEAAYRRGDLFEKRVRFMADWAVYCAAPPVPDSPKVIPIRGSSG